MILDFYTYSVEEVLSCMNPIEDWQKEIVLFLVEWTQNNESLEVQTSGSTGTPKKITVSKEAMKKSAEMTAAFLELPSNSSAVLCLPVRYIAGKMMMVRAITQQWKLDIIPPTSHISSAVLSSKSYDFIALTPMQAQESIEVLPFFRKIIIGGAAVSESLQKRFANLPQSIYIFETFGMTETLSHIAMRQLFPQTEEEFQILPGVTVAIDEENCLIIQMPFLSSTIHTKDTVEITSKGFIFKGRKDFVINSGGIKLYPQDIENKLQPFIKNFYISSKKDEKLGEKVVLVVQETAEKSFDTIFEKAQLTQYEKPKEIIQVSSFKYTPTQKLIREKFD